MNAEENRIIELEKELMEVCSRFASDCTKCPKQAECDEYAHLDEKLEWN